VDLCRPVAKARVGKDQILAERHVRILRIRATVEVARTPRITGPANKPEDGDENQEAVERGSKIHFRLKL